MPHRALTEVLLGHGPSVRAGELIPDTFPDQYGDPQAVDFERLVELGAAEEVTDEPEGYSDLTVEQLKTVLAERSIDVEGKPKKAELVAALEADDAAEPDPDAGGDPDAEAPPAE